MIVEGSVNEEQTKWDKFLDFLYLNFNRPFNSLPYPCGIIYANYPACLDSLPFNIGPRNGVLSVRITESSSLTKAQVVGLVVVASPALLGWRPSRWFLSECKLKFIDTGGVNFLWRIKIKLNAVSRWVTRVCHRMGGGGSGAREGKRSPNKYKFEHDDNLLFRKDEEGGW